MSKFQQKPGYDKHDMALEAMMEELCREGKIIRTNRVRNTPRR
jgi:hypothetical protein